MAEHAVRPERRLRVGAGALFGALMVRAVGATWRVRWQGTPPAGAAVYALWHGELLPLLWAMRGRAISPLISTHADGEVIARIVRSLGYAPIRGSSSRGGARALIDAVRQLAAGRSVAFTTDGPRGPRRQSAPGALAAAVRAGVPVVPLGARVSHGWRLRSWDRFVIPGFFAQITVHVGAPLLATDPKDVGPLDRALHAVCAPDDA